jgi:hypothetical protein
MDLLVVVAVSFVLGGAVMGLAVYWHTVRPKSLDQAHLDWKLGGLVQFGNDGAHLEFEETESGDRTRLTKRVREAPDLRECIELEAWHRAGPEFVDAVRASMSLLDPNLAFDLEAPTRSLIHLRLFGGVAREPVLLEAVLRAVIRALGHPEHARYKIVFEGPSDNLKVAQHYGWRD